jgi:peptide/nickel transport system permease protein
MTPIVAPLDSTSWVLGGVLLTETVFNIPRTGTLPHDAIVRNYSPVIQAPVFFRAFDIVALTPVVHAVFAFLHPGVRY